MFAVVLTITVVCLDELRRHIHREREAREKAERQAAALQRGKGTIKLQVHRFFSYGVANVLLVNSVSTINTAPGEARVEEKLFFFVTCLLPKFGVSRNFVISLQLSSRRS